MNTDLLHKYFKGETTEQEESLIVEWVEESAENKARYLKERMLYDVSLFSDKTTGKKWNYRMAPLFGSIPKRH